MKKVITNISSNNALYIESKLIENVSYYFQLSNKTVSQKIHFKRYDGICFNISIPLDNEIITKTITDRNNLNLNDSKLSLIKTLRDNGKKNKEIAEIFGNF